MSGGWRGSGSVWAPNARSVTLVADHENRPLERDGEWWVPASPLEPGARYGFRIDDADEVLADPRSRFQPEGPDGLSEVIDPADYEWRSAAPRCDWDRAVIYEAHVGTFRPGGTFGSAVDGLDHLSELGVSHLELLPVAGFAGSVGWGYDGVHPFAPHAAYGTPDDLRAMIDACHGRGIAVIMDVVLNHLGPAGNRLRDFGPYFTDRYTTPWGDGFNFDGPGADEVRRFLIDAALMWVTDYRVDGLRVDAAHACIDTSAVHFLEQLTTEVTAAAHVRGDDVVMIAEWDRSDPKIVRDVDHGGLGFDAHWSDDLHHALHVALTGEQLGYYADFAGGPERIADIINHGYGLRGGWSTHHGRRYGRDPGEIDRRHLVTCLQNHDQVGNRADGARIHHLVGSSRAAAAVLLVLASPGVPMLFQGEEWHASASFAYFCDHETELGRAISEGRQREFEAFGWAPESILDPQEQATFEAARLNWSEIDEPEHLRVLRWYESLIALRRSRPELRASAPFEATTDGPSVLVRRRDLVAVANLSSDRSTTIDSGTILTSWGQIRQIDAGRLAVEPGAAVVIDTGPTAPPGDD